MERGEEVRQSEETLTENVRMPNCGEKAWISREQSRFGTFWNLNRILCFKCPARTRLLQRSDANKKRDLDPFDNGAFSDVRAK